MSYNIKGILINDSNFDSYQIDNNEYKDNKVINNLSKVNIFIGANNCGKSRFVRNLFLAKNLEFIPNNLNIEKINEVINNYKKTALEFVKKLNIIDYGGAVQTTNTVNELNEYINENQQFLKPFYDSINKLSSLTNGLSITNNGFVPSNTEPIFQGLKQIAKAYEKEMSEVISGFKNIYSFKKVYIPTLRGLRPLVNNESNLYRERTVIDYFTLKNDSGMQHLVDLNSENIFTGLNMYEEVKRLLLGNLSDREKISEFQKFLGENFFNDEDVALIPSINSDVLYVKIGNEKEQPIYNLGDGIQSIIILTFPLFANTGNDLLFFIEEPELYMHPGLQRKLIETFDKPEFDNYQYFITTHSNHFLDISLDIKDMSIYTFKKKFENSEDKEKTPIFNIDNVSNEDNSTLDLLGVRNSSVFLSNCTIWVEGITDRYYLRHYLKIYQNSLNYNKKRYKEDLHYSFIEYSGNNITHWSFLDDNESETYSTINVDRICNKLFLITDKDNEKKLSRQEKLSQSLQDRYYCLECKEIENLITKKVLLKVISLYENTQDLKELNFKKKNFSESDYKNKYLGKYVEDNLINKKRTGKYCSESGTVSDKVGFCKKAISFIKSIDDMSEEAKMLCKRIYNFIDSNNL